MDKETTTTVTIDRKTFVRLDRLAKSNNVSKKDYLSCALEYFEKYGINPVEHEDLERMKKGEEVQPFFNHFRNYVSAREVTFKIDNGGISDWT